MNVLSTGAVSPGGIGIQGLRVNWPQTEPQHKQKTPVYLVDRTLPQLQRWEKQPRLRRASPISYFMIEAAQQALDACPGLDRERTGVVASFFLGCIVYSVRFYRQMEADGRRFASPLLFPETVFNSPVSHLVSTLGLGGPVYTQVGDKSCWASALRTADCWLRSGSADQVLVIGAEEFDSHELDAFAAAGWTRPPFAVAEGAGAVLLGGGNEGVQLAGLTDGHSFGSKAAALQAGRDCLEAVGTAPLLPTATAWTTRIQQAVAGNTLEVPPLPGEAFTASAAWDTIRAAELLEAGREVVVPYWGLTQQFAAARLAL